MTRKAVWVSRPGIIKKFLDVSKMIRPDKQSYGTVILTDQDVLEFLLDFYLNSKNGVKP